MLPYIPESLSGIAEELNDWIYGKKENVKLDEWHDKYGKHFINKRI